jgi:hypothetical protein
MNSRNSITAANTSAGEVKDLQKDTRIFVRKGGFEPLRKVQGDQIVSGDNGLGHKKSIAQRIRGIGQPRRQFSAGGSPGNQVSLPAATSELWELECVERSLRRCDIPRDSLCSHLQAGNYCASGNCYLLEYSQSHRELNKARASTGHVLPRIWRGRTIGTVGRFSAGRGLSDEPGEWLVYIEGCQDTDGLVLKECP